MALKRTHLKSAMVLGFSTLTIMAFQNCSNSNFSEDQKTAVFKAASISDNSVAVADPGQTVETPQAGQIPEDNHSVTDPVAEGDDVADSLVECELISPKQKIIFDQVLSEGSNNSATRVCMSENACLKLVNSYAAKRDCQLSLGASSLQDSESQCTKIFPGSQGTCRNAGRVSDEKVAEVLDLMGKAH